MRTLLFELEKRDLTWLDLYGAARREWMIYFGLYLSPFLFFQVVLDVKCNLWSHALHNSSTPPPHSFIWSVAVWFPPLIHCVYSLKSKFNIWKLIKKFDDAVSQLAERVTRAATTSCSFWVWTRRLAQEGIACDIDPYLFRRETSTKD